MHQDIISLFEAAVAASASDLLLTANTPPVLRLHGELRFLEAPPLDPDAVRKMAYAVMTDAEIATFERDGEVDMAANVAGRRFRGNIYRQRDALAAAFRLVPTSIPEIQALGLPAALEELALVPQGFLLITGPTGSGKSTTMASIIEHLNRRRRAHVITIEDPIEFVFTSKKSIVDQREVGRDTQSFASALRHALRETPDVIMVGEMRDTETISAALTAAETGHLVLATLHTGSTVQSIDRIVDVFPPHQQGQIRLQLSFTLLAVLAQKLVPRADGTGLALATELLRNNSAIANLIREGKTQMLAGVLETQGRMGMHTMDSSMTDLYRRGLITREDAIRRMEHPQALDRG
ncbi:MAG TPA: type IV pilus twitching motility protein PilT [Planctomycetota bacterium]|nr:type IV pilus twitching motility protein PilT [Planctomycetota bacterium]